MKLSPTQLQNIEKRFSLLVYCLEKFSEASCILKIRIHRVILVGWKSTKNDGGYKITLWSRISWKLKCVEDWCL